MLSIKTYLNSGTVSLVDNLKKQIQANCFTPKCVLVKCHFIKYLFLISFVSELLFALFLYVYFSSFVIPIL